MDYLDLEKIKVVHSLRKNVYIIKEKIQCFLMNFVMKMVNHFAAVHIYLKVIALSKNILQLAKNLDILGIKIQVDFHMQIIVL